MVAIQEQQASGKSDSVKNHKLPASKSGLTPAQELDDVYDQTLENIAQLRKELRETSAQLKDELKDVNKESSRRDFFMNTNHLICAHNSRHGDQLVEIYEETLNNNNRYELPQDLRKSKDLADEKSKCYDKEKRASYMDIFSNMCKGLGEMFKDSPYAGLALVGSIAGSTASTSYGICAKKESEDVTHTMERMERLMNNFDSNDKELHEMQKQIVNQLGNTLRELFKVFDAATGGRNA